MSLSNQRISIRDHMVALAANGQPFFDALKSLGLCAFELQVDPDLSTPHVRRADGSPFLLTNERDLRDLQLQLKAGGVSVSAILLMTDFSSDMAAEHVQWAIRAASLAKRLGAQAIRIDPLTRNKELPIPVVQDNFIRGIKEVLRGTAGTAVDFGIENHGPAGNDPAFLDAVFAAVDDPRLGLTLDTGNFYWWGVPLTELYELLERYAPRTKHTHVKNINYPPELASTRRPIGLDYGKYCCRLDEGNIDLRRVVKILTDAGYTRDFCIENESLHKVPPEMKMDALRRDVAAIADAQA